MIVDCRECKHKVSSEAVSCPSCGCPLKPATEAAAATAPPPAAAPAAPAPAKKSHINGWIALIAFLMSNFTPAILAPLIILVGFIFSLLEISKGGKVFGGIMLALCAMQGWFIADHFGKISGSLGLTNPKQIEEDTVKKYSGMDLGVPANASQVISQKCSEEWPADYRMRNHCEEQQRSALTALDRGQPSSVTRDAFVIIRGKCAQEWPRDFRMRVHCESQQYDGYASLQSSNTPASKRGSCAQQWPADYRMRQHCESR